MIKISEKESLSSSEHFDNSNIDNDMSYKNEISNSNLIETNDIESYIR